MPIYSYEIIATGEVFEHPQNLAEPRLTVHPVSGAPVRRLITVPNLTLNHSEGANRTLLGDNNLAKLGFTKYVKAAPGHYVKTTGDPAAPTNIQPRL
jgi:hypothetical protein